MEMEKDNDNRQFIFANNLKRLLRENEMTQKDLCDRLNMIEGIEVTRQSVNAWCKGVTSPQVKMLIAIADILKVSYDELLMSDKQRVLQEKRLLAYYNRSRSRAEDLILALNDSEKILLANYRKLNEQDKEMVDRMVAYTVAATLKLNQN